MNRRQFAFWLSAGLFGLAERLHASSLDALAALVVQCVEVERDGRTVIEQQRWRAAENDTWRWFERETFREGVWEPSGITTPVNKLTGERYAGAIGYLDESLVPAAVRQGEVDPEKGLTEIECVETAPGVASVARKAREGRPPSKWLRSLYADELACWLHTIEVSPVGVGGMTVWTHLTRDHGFDPEKIEGLTEEEQFKLHAAAHHGY